MRLSYRHRWFAQRWFVAAVGVTLAFGLVSRFSHPGYWLTAFSDLVGLVIMLAGGWAAFSNINRRPVQERSFWIPMAIGFVLWGANETAWCYYEIVLKRHVPDPFIFDIVLFFHLVPMIAAVAWRPDLLKKEGRIHFSTLNFLLLLGWWSFIYAFIVFPHQYVVLNVNLCDYYYDLVYELENGLLLVVLGLAAFTSSGGWRRVYLNLCAGTFFYGIGSKLLDAAVSNNTYFSGSWYDVPFIASLAWMAATVLSARDWDLRTEEFRLDPRWKKLIPRLAMLATLSLPVLGLWTVFYDHSVPRIRVFRICAVLAAMVLLGSFLFLRQYIQDRALMRVLADSRESYARQKRLQNQLVQKEKLASLGTLVAGAAHEINDPLNSVMTFAEQFWVQEGLKDEQNALLRKIVAQAQRTRDLMSNLLSFAQQSPGEKSLVDLTVLLSRAVQLLEAQYPGGKTRVSLVISPDFPRVQGNPNRLFQVFVEMIENGLDALQEAGGGLLEINAHRQREEAVLQFSDNGPGLREPERVFDPFYTTKPVGKGTGLGLSVVYGVVQEHGGQITCQNKPQGGALFIIRLPATAEAAAMTARA